MKSFHQWWWLKGIIRYIDFCLECTFYLVIFYILLFPNVVFLGQFLEAESCVIFKEVVQVCDEFFFPLSAYYCIGDLFIIMSGLCHIGACAQGVIVKLVILLTFHTAVRVVAMTVFLKQL